MTGSGQRALLFLDVDGPLIPFGGASDEYATYPVDRDPEGAAAHPLLTRLDPRHGDRLAALPCDLVWATTWRDEANECLAPRLGLPPLPVVDWPEPSDLDERDARIGLHWKTRVLVDWAAGRPFAWVDDEIGDTDRAWVSAHHPGRALLHRVDHRRGLVDADYDVLEKWLRGAAEGPSYGTHLLPLLRALDDPQWPEWPRDYDRTRVSVLVERLAARLSDDFAVRCTTEQDTQDSSEYGRVTVPGEATVCGTRIVVCVSRFGSLALVTADNPGAYFGTDDARDEGDLDAGDLATVVRALNDLEYVVVPEEVLALDYDGPTRLPSHIQRPSWWDRFFGFF